MGKDGTGNSETIKIFVKEFVRPETKIEKKKTVYHLLG